MRFLKWDEVFGPWTGRIKPLQDAKWQELNEDVLFDGWAYARGSRFKIWENNHYKFVTFAPDTRTPNGKKPGKLMHRF